MNDTAITHVESLVPNWSEAQIINSPATNMLLLQSAIVLLTIPG